MSLSKTYNWKVCFHLISLDRTLSSVGAIKSISEFLIKLAVLRACKDFNLKYDWNKVKTPSGVFLLAVNCV